MVKLTPEASTCDVLQIMAVFPRNSDEATQVSMDIEEALEKLREAGMAEIVKRGTLGVPWDSLNAQDTHRMVFVAAEE
jgi:hypothetical protein